MNKTKEIIKATIVGIPLIGIAIWTKSYLLLPIILGGLAIYLYGDYWENFKELTRKIPTRKRKAIEITISAIIGGILAGYILVFLIDIEKCNREDGKAIVYVIDKTKYGAIKNGDAIETYHRTWNRGEMERGDMIAIYVTDDGTRTKYVSRIAAIAGDTVKIENGRTKVNGQETETNSKEKCSYIISNYTSFKMLHEMQREVKNANKCDTAIFRLCRIKNEWRQYLRAPQLKNIPDKRLYPYREEIHWNAYNYGPILIPSCGMTIELNDMTYAIYSDIIKNNEKTEIEKRGGKYYSGNKQMTEYTFKLNYYWIINDNKDICNDSRYYGPISENSIIGHVMTRL